VNTAHPTREKTKTAAAFLKNAFRGAHEIYFGYLGEGLITSDDTCSFASRGLTIEEEKITGSLFSSIMIKRENL
jgi:hypothetical protein